jgi:nucleotide-binding universal stress UspA family protein
VFKSILVPVDLAEPELAKPAIDTACAMARATAGTIRLINVLPMTPVMLAAQVCRRRACCAGPRLRAG